MDELHASVGQPGAWFGQAVDVSGDTALVGAIFENDRGAAYVFERQGGIWMQVARLTASDGELDDRFGSGVALDGETALVGAYQNGASGAAYVFEKPSGGWADTTETAKLMPSDGAQEDEFAFTVALSGGTALIGASQHDGVGVAYVYERPAGGWVNASETAQLRASDAGFFDWFAISVALDGDTALVGARFHDSAGPDAGAAYVFVRSGAQWTNSFETAKLTASDAATNDNFGLSVAVTEEMALVGASQEDSAGTSSGAAYIFERPTAGWVDATQTAKLTAANGAAGDEFGWSVAVAGDLALIGARYADAGGAEGAERGAAYSFRRPPGGWEDSTETARLVPSEGTDGSWFGWSVALEGTTALVSANLDDDGALNAGSVYAFCPLPALAFLRNPGASNPASYSIASSAPNDLPILGGTFSLFVDASGTTGHTHSTVLGFLEPSTHPLPGGQVLLLDLNAPGGELLQFGVQTGDTALTNLTVPSDPGLCGLQISTQAVHLFGVSPFALSNAWDLRLGPTPHH